jgi:hypothetical protein
VTVELEPLPAGTTNLTSLLPQFNASGTLIGTTPVRRRRERRLVGNRHAARGYPWPVYGGPLGLNFANLGNGKMLMTSTQVFRIEPL